MSEYLNYDCINCGRHRVENNGICEKCNFDNILNEFAQPMLECLEHGAGTCRNENLIEELRSELDRRDEELKITDNLLKEATETIGAVVACCTYNSNDDAKIGIYGVDQKAFTRIDQFITHYNDAVSAGKVSVDVKQELSGAEIEELGAQEAERKEFCPNCEAETPCTHEAELFVCDICGEDFAKYIVSRNCNVSDVSTTQDVTTPEPHIRGGDGSHWEGCEEVHLDCRIAQLEAELARLNAERRWIPVSERLPEIHDDYDGEKSDCCYAIDIHKCVWIAYYRPDEKDWYELPAGIILTTITHWMPLPPAPESEV